MQLNEPYLLLNRLFDSAKSYLAEFQQFRVSPAKLYHPPKPRWKPPVTNGFKTNYDGIMLTKNELLWLFETLKVKFWLLYVRKISATFLRVDGGDFSS